MKLVCHYRRMWKIKLIASIILAFTTVFSLAFVNYSYAQFGGPGPCDGSPPPAGCPTPAPGGGGGGGGFQSTGGLYFNGVAIAPSGDGIYHLSGPVNSSIGPYFGFSGCTTPGWFENSGSDGPLDMTYIYQNFSASHPYRVWDYCSTPGAGTGDPPAWTGSGSQGGIDYIVVDAITQPTPPPTAPSATLTANPTSVDQGHRSTLTWTSQNATQCSGTNFSTGTNNVGPPSGAVSSPALTNTTTFTVTCTGSGGSGTAQATVTVLPPGQTPPSVTLTANPPSVNPPPNSSTLTWTVGGGTATSCTASGGWSGSKAKQGGNEVQNNLAATTTYTLICTGPGGDSVPASVTVTVNQVGNSQTLNLNGSFIARGGFQLQRHVSNTNTTAAELFYERPDFDYSLLQLSPSVSTMIQQVLVVPSYTWQEVNP